MLKKVLLTLLTLIVLLLGGVYVYVYSFMPQYEGAVTLTGLKEEVTVHFDEYGIPHIYGQNEKDTYFALGYIHAQERAFQMDLMRRAAQGRLSEILGTATVDTDRFFRTLGIYQAAQKSMNFYKNKPNAPFISTVEAYLKGVNTYAQSHKAIEHAILGVDFEPFTLADVYAIGGLMAFGFAEAFKTEPIVELIKVKMGDAYLHDLALAYPSGMTKIPTTVSAFDSVNSTDMAYHHTAIQEALAALPIPLWIGSNAWVIAPQKTKAGKVILANDTHMGYAQPAVWYEAHLEYPGFSLYGRHAGGIPFALIGHNRNAAWGLTMFENDDVDFYREKVNPENPNQYWAVDHWDDFIIREETIQVKDSAAIALTVRSTKHGPLISDLTTHDLHHQGNAPIAVWWSFLQLENKSIETFYELARAKQLEDARKAARKLDAPGLNIMFGDSQGNIAWWASAKLFKRPDHVHSKYILDGASGKDDPVEFLDFAYNPKSENPKSGFVYSANNQPDTMNGHFVPGYYVPEDRGKAIATLLTQENQWDMEKVRQMNFFTTSLTSPAIAKEIAAAFKSTPSTDQKYVDAITLLKNWDGSHELDDIAPSVYYKTQYYILKYSMEDEMGAELFKSFLSSHLMKRSWAGYIQNDSAVWWDDITTKDMKETRSAIVTKAVKSAVTDLEALFERVAEAKWGDIHTLKHNHAFKAVPLLDKFFSVGTFPMVGGNETINNEGFRLYPNKQGGFSIVFGPAMRSIIDFSDIENSVSVLPTGQSGFFLSPHYDDQAPLYNSGRNRKQMMNQAEIIQTKKSTLTLQP
ncbi:MAG: penicillin acylase family protein [Flammeovirgaceae bacterium]